MLDAVLEWMLSTCRSSHAFGDSEVLEACWKTGSYVHVSRSLTYDPDWPLCELEAFFEPQIQASSAFNEDDILSLVGAYVGGADVLVLLSSSAHDGSCRFAEYIRGRDGLP